MKFRNASLLGVLIISFATLSMGEEMNPVPGCTGDYKVKSSESMADGNLTILEIGTLRADKVLYDITGCLHSAYLEAENREFLRKLQADPGKQKLVKELDSLWEITNPTAAEIKQITDLREKLYGSPAERYERESKLNVSALKKMHSRFKFNYIEGLITDKENKTDYALQQMKVDPYAYRKEVICAGLDEASEDYKWCMGEKTGTPAPGCKNRYGDSCGSKYKSTGNNGFELTK